MGRKSKQYRASIKTLELARRKKSEARQGGGVAETESYFADSNPDPEAEEEVSASVAIEVDDEDEPNQVETEDADSDTDLDNGPERPDVERFSSMLQEAQRLAVQIEKDEQAQKRKTPKTYRGDSKKTQYRREKARKDLASKGFLNLVSFMALKKREREEVDAQNVHESADSDVQEVDRHGGDSAPSGTPGFPVNALSGRTCHRGVALAEEEEESSPGSDSESGAGMREVNWHGGASALSRTLGLAITASSGGSGNGRENMVLADEEMGSPRSEPEPGAVAREVDWRCGGSAPSGTSGLAIATLSGRYGHGNVVLEEEEEGSPESEPELAAHWPEYPHEVGWRSQGFAPSVSTGSSVTGGADDEDSSLEDEEQHALSVGSSGHESLGLEPGSDLGDSQSELALLQDAEGSLYSGPEDLDGLGGGNGDREVSVQADQGAEDAKRTVNAILEALRYTL
ncbi:hypothetical protein EDB86DRAFT_2836683 [Lactarius hatsudake]|nr:hypothetical protein EDB86DRAFT_2836683 [Lactarius hatsudake]